jgi:alpha-1,3-glucosyltransferase
MLKPTRKRLLYALLNGSLGFFLFSFQVHEKSILLPLLPATMLLLEDHIAGMAFTNVAMFRYGVLLPFFFFFGAYHQLRLHLDISMYPLLKRDKLVVPTIIVTCLYNLVMGSSLHKAPLLITLFIMVRLPPLVVRSLPFQKLTTPPVLSFLSCSA